MNLLHKFQSILQRETLKSDLDSKLNIIFQNYGIELEQVQQLYEKQKHDPPIPRNLPPVAGNITWSRHLLKRIEARARVSHAPLPRAAGAPRAAGVRGPRAAHARDPSRPLARAPSTRPPSTRRPLTPPRLRRSP